MHYILSLLLTLSHIAQLPTHILLLPQCLFLSPPYIILFVVASLIVSYCCLMFFLAMMKNNAGTFLWAHITLFLNDNFYTANFNCGEPVGVEMELLTILFSWFFLISYRLSINFLELFDHMTLSSNKKSNSQMTITSITLIWPNNLQDFQTIYIR